MITRHRETGHVYRRQLTVNGFAQKYTRCWPHNLNCRDPRLQKNNSEEFVALSRCLDDENGKRSLPMPRVMHFACGSMPTQEAYTARGASIYERTWAMHLVQSNKHIAEQANLAGGPVKLVSTDSSRVLDHYNPWLPLCSSGTLSPEAKLLLQCPSDGNRVWS